MALGDRKTREAVVVSDAMQKTRVVRIERVYRHPRYERVVRSAKKVKAHDEANESRVGDRVLIEETRPLSREKRGRTNALSTAPHTAMSEQHPAQDNAPADLICRRRHTA